MTPPRIFDWLLRRSLPPGPAGDSIRGDLIEELSSSADPRRARRRFRTQVISIAMRYARRRTPAHEIQPRRDVVGLLRQQLEFAVRSLIARPSYSLIVVATLALGIVGGLAAAWGFGRIVRNLLYGVQPSDLASMGIGVGVLAAAGTLAAWIPVRRASRTDPIQALRYE